MKQQRQHLQAAIQHLRAAIREETREETIPMRTPLGVKTRWDAQLDSKRMKRVSTANEQIIDVLKPLDMIEATIALSNIVGEYFAVMADDPDREQLLREWLAVTRAEAEERIEAEKEMAAINETKQRRKR
jgi:hypothetical protein